jgi:hypothetical protein
MPFDESHFQVIYSEVQRHREDTETSKLGHWEAARVYDRIHRIYLGLPATILSIGLAWLLSSQTQKSVSQTVALGDLALQVSILVSLVISLLTGLTTFLNLGDLATRHRGAAESLHALWRDCINWSTDFPDSTTCEKAAEKVQTYRRRLNELNEKAPQIPRWAWKGVRRQRSEGSVSYNMDNQPPASATNNLAPGGSA